MQTSNLPELYRWQNCELAFYRLRGSLIITHLKREIFFLIITFKLSLNFSRACSRDFHLTNAHHLSIMCNILRPFVGTKILFVAYRHRSTSRGLECRSSSTACTSLCIYDEHAGLPGQFYPLLVHTLSTRCRLVVLLSFHVI